MAGTEVERSDSRELTKTEEWLSQQTGVTVEEVGGKRMISITPQLEQRVHVLGPISQVVQLDPNWSPNPRIVQLNVQSDSFPVQGGRALNKVGLAKLADLAQIEIVDQKRDYMGGTGITTTTTAKMRGPDGLWRHSTQSKTVRFDQLRRKVARRLREKNANVDDDAIDKAYDEELEFVNEKAETKSFLRCVRLLLSVKGKYSAAELAKPFLVIGWNMTPDWSNPHVRDLIAAQFRSGAAELYGGSAEDAEPVAQIEDTTPDPDVSHADRLAQVPADLDELDAAEEAAEEGGDPVDLSEVEAGGAEPEEWDVDGNTEDAFEIPKPERGFKPKKGPFAGQDVEDIVSEDDGRRWLAELVDAMLGADDPRKEKQGRQALEWLEWGSNGEITEETLGDYLAG
jgi:hypothetical protein